VLTTELDGEIPLDHSRQPRYRQPHPWGLSCLLESLRRALRKTRQRPLFFNHFLNSAKNFFASRLIALLFISLFADVVLYAVARLETARLLSFGNQGYKDMQFYIYGTLFLMVVPVISTASVALADARESDAVSYWLFFLSTIIASVLWIGGNLMLDGTGFGNIDQFRRATGFSGGSTGLVLVMQTLVGLGICAVVALYESLIWRLAMCFARFR
jgi:hypothetical protein